jgi:hypothetical protein
MTYKLMLFVAFIGLGLYFFGYTQNLVVMQVAGGILTGSMFTVYMLRKLARR